MAARSQSAEQKQLWLLYIVPSFLKLEFYQRNCREIVPSLVRNIKMFCCLYESNSQYYFPKLLSLVVPSFGIKRKGSFVSILCMRIISCSRHEKLHEIKPLKYKICNSINWMTGYSTSLLVWYRYTAYAINEIHIIQVG